MYRTTLIGHSYSWVTALSIQLTTHTAQIPFNITICQNCVHDVTMELIIIVENKRDFSPTSFGKQTFAVQCHFRVALVGLLSGIKSLGNLFFFCIYKNEKFG